MNAGLIGGIAGGVIGLLGGIVGAYFSIKNTKSQRERAFVIKCCAICLIAIGAFCILGFTLPGPYRHLLWIPYSILLPSGIVAVNRRQQKIREMESHKNPDHPTAGNVPI
jgi:hypothetical protein